MDISKIPEHILSDVRERVSDDAIATMTPREVFTEYCMWNGLINWGNTLFDAVENLKAADAAKPADTIRATIEAEISHTLSHLNLGTMTSESVHNLIRDKSNVYSNAKLAGMCAALAIYNATA